jgi:regulatory protein
MAVKHPRNKKPRPPLDGEGLERLALFYVGRYATTRARLAAYLRRKVTERGWGEPGSAPVEAMVERFAGLGYVDDAAFASARAASLGRRGYGERRVADALRAAGVGEADGQAAREQSRDGAWAAALRFAERRRLGPWAKEAPDWEGRQKAAAAMLRAGHPADLVRRVLAASPGDVPEPDVN